MFKSTSKSCQSETGKLDGNQMKALESALALGDSTSKRAVASRGRRARRLMAIMTLSLVTLVTVAAAPVSAYTYRSSYQPGSVVTQKTLGDGRGVAQARLNSGVIKAYRSPATTGTQLITVSWRVWEYYRGTWVSRAWPAVTYTAYAGQYVNTNGWYYDTIGGFFATETFVTWRTTTGVVLGSALFDYVHSTDYQCVPSIGCEHSYFGGQDGLKVF